jgi:hypothetical protein
MRIDHCKGCRKTYAAALELFASNNWVAGFIAGLPLYYLGAMMIVYHKAAVATLLSGGSYSFLGALICAWANACLCLWRIWPNGLTLSIFLLKALGYWSFVSFFILLFYGVSRLPLEITTYLCIMIMPEIIMLLFTADVLRAARSRHFKALEVATAMRVPAVVRAEAADPTVTVHVDQESL